MKYIRKICPACGNEFIVLKEKEEKAIYCTLKCFLESQEQVEENKFLI